MKFRVHVLAFFFLGTSAETAFALTKYDTFVGQYMASFKIASACDGITTYDTQGAGTIAKSEDGLRRQKVLRLLYYGKTDGLVKLGDAFLTARDIDPNNDRQLCRFGRSVAGSEDKIGRFLRVK